MPVRHYSTLVEPNPDDADDERSLSDIDEVYFARLRSPRRQIPTPQFPGQDIRPTSRKELTGWYAYAWAAEVFVVCGIGSFIPVTLEQLARENGVLLSDESRPCSGRFPAHPDGTAPPAERNSQCVVYILGARINTASFAM
jgi:UMF1 family MFS transporter